MNIFIFKVKLWKAYLVGHSSGKHDLENNPTLGSRRADLKAFLAGGSFPSCLFWEEGVVWGFLWVFFSLGIGCFIFILNSSHGKISHVTFKQFKILRPSFNVQHKPLLRRLSSFFVRLFQEMGFFVCV